MIPRRLLPLAAVLAAAAAQTGAQSFEVASIKPNAASDNRIMIRMEPGGRFNATGITVKALIGLAYNIRDFQVINAPGWLGVERYDISAKAPDGMGDRLSMDIIRPMLKGLLEERFVLKTHQEAKEMPVFALVLSKNGHKLTPTAGGQGANMRMGRGQLTASKVSMPMLAQQLSAQLGRTVLDKTELAGEFDIKLEWTPEHGQGGVVSSGPPPPDALPAADSSGPTIFTALQEQLGLRLESTKGPVPMIVIDRVEKPTEN